MADITKADITCIAEPVLGKSFSVTLGNVVEGCDYKITCLLISSDTIISMYDYTGETSKTVRISLTLPLSVAAEYPNNSSFSVRLYVRTYDADGNYIGIASTSARTCTIPPTIVPTISINVGDSLGYADSYGGYLQALSKVAVNISASGAYGSTIKAYNTEIDGNTYTSAEVESNILKSTGTLEIVSTVTDSRGRTATARESITVLPYTPPRVNSLSVVRTDQNGNAQKNGEYLTVTFDSVITSLDRKNSAEYAILYKRVSEIDFQRQELNAISGVYDVTGQKFTFEASANSSWNVSVVAADDFRTVTRSAIGSSTTRLFSILAKGLGFAFGKTADLADTLEIAFKTKFTGGITPNELLSGADLDTIKTVCSYSGLDASTAAYVNCPISSGAFALEVLGCGSGQLFQRLTSADGIYHRFYDGQSWTEWVR